MNKKQAAGVFIMSFFLVVPAFAKSKQQVQQQLNADDIVAKMKMQLGLTDEQVMEVKPIIEDHLAQEQQLKLEEKKQLSKVLTGEQLYTWNFLQNEPPRGKKKKSLL
jgi:regulator of replication initiation timing